MNDSFLSVQPTVNGTRSVVEFDIFMVSEYL